LWSALILLLCDFNFQGKVMSTKEIINEFEKDGLIVIASLLRNYRKSLMKGACTSDVAAFEKVLIHYMSDSEIIEFKDQFFNT